MAPSSSLDDPAAINRFLETMRGGSSSTQTTGPQARPALNPESTEFYPHVEDKKPERSDQENIAPRANVAAPPPEQWGQTSAWQTPSQSPFPQAPTSQKTDHLDFVQDDSGFMTEEPAPVLTPRSPNVARATPQARPITPTQYRLLNIKNRGIHSLTEAKLSELKEQTDGYMDKVVERIRRVNQAKFQQEQAIVNEPATPVIKQERRGTPDSIPYPEFDETPTNAQVGEKDDVNTALKREEWLEEKPTPVPLNTPIAESSGLAAVQQMQKPPSSFPTFAETAVTNTPSKVKLFNDAFPAPSTPTNMTMIIDKTKPSPSAELSRDLPVKELDSPNGGVMVEEKLGEFDKAVKGSVSPTIIVTVESDTDDNTTEEEEVEDRENLTRFKSWGTPLARNKPKSRQRTIVFTGLPRDIDLTSVQSLVHGGAIECMRLVPGSLERPTISAHVTFTSADSCDRFYDMYPNGLDIRHQGKKWPVLVDKKEAVDVISGMLQGYLDCGATRVVKVSNADDGWGVIALDKLARGKNDARQVEAVLDVYHNGTRTITFRFANIQHAVQFKGILIRDDDWKGSHVEFADDPCAEATSVRKIDQCPCLSAQRQ